MKEVKVLKKDVLDYLEYAPNEIDPLRLAKWLETRSRGNFYVISQKDKFWFWLVKMIGTGK